jgi:hypothetical protein
LKQASATTPDGSESTLPRKASFHSIPLSEDESVRVASIMKQQKVDRMQAVKIFMQEKQQQG